MIYTVDIGNSNIVGVVFDSNGTIVYDSRMETIKTNDREGYLDLFKKEKKNFSEKPEALVLSCVVPAVQDLVIEVLNEVFDCQVINLNVQLLDDIEIKLDNPLELGADILATTYGAISEYNLPCIVADLGSATKITAIDENSVFLGGIIMQGIGFTASSIHDMIPHLPNIEIEKPDKIIGHNTIECIQSGVINGAIAAVCEVTRRIEVEVGAKCKKIITGGYSKLFDETCDLVYDEFLLSKGLLEVYRRYKRR